MLTGWSRWSTTRKSNLLTRNNGNPAALARLQLWGAIEPLPGLVLYGQTEGEGRPRPAVMTSSSAVANAASQTPAMTISPGSLVSIYGVLGIGNALQFAMNTIWAVPRNSRPNPFLTRARNIDR